MRHINHNDDFDSNLSAGVIRCFANDSIENRLEASKSEE